METFTFTFTVVLVIQMILYWSQRSVATASHDMLSYLSFSRDHWRQLCNVQNCWTRTLHSVI